MSLLAAWLAEDERAETRELYVGNMLWSILRMFAKEVPILPLSELMQEERVHDDRTAQDIVDEIIKMLEK